MELKASIDTSGLEGWGRRTEALVRQAASRAGSDALRAMKAEASRQIRDRKAIKVSAIGKALTTIFPTSKENLTWTLRASSAPMPVIAFGAKQNRKGVSVEINKGKRVLIRGAFIATMRSGHEGVFYRTSKKRLPIDEAYTSRISEVFRDVTPAILARGMDVFRTAFARNTKAGAP